MAFHALADYQNHVIGWLQWEQSSLGDGAVVRFPRIRMSSGECRFKRPSEEHAMTTGSDLTALFRANFELCEIGPGQSVAVLSEGELLPGIPRRLFKRGLGSRRRGARRQYPVRGCQGRQPPHRQSWAKSAVAHTRKRYASAWTPDMVVDHMLLLFSHEQIEMQKSRHPNSDDRRAGGDSGAPVSEP